MDRFDSNGCQRAAHKAMLSGARAESNPTSISELVALQEEGNKAFHEFKEKNDKRLAEIEKRGHADAVLEEQVNKISAQIGDQAARIDAFISKQEKITAQMDEVDARMQRMGIAGFPSMDASAQAQAFFAQRARRNGLPFNPEAVSVDSYKAYIAAFDHYLRNPIDALNSDIRNELSIGSDKDGGYLVSPERSTEIFKRLQETSPIRQYARTVPIGKDKLVLPLRLNKLVMGGYGTEKQQPTATGTGDMGEQVFEVHRLWAMPEVTQDFLDDADVDVMAWLDEEALEAFSITENSKFVNGNGVKQPRGFMSYSSTAVNTNDGTRDWGVVQYKPGGHASLLNSPDALIDMVTATKAGLRANARWAGNRFTFGAIRKIKDGQGNYIWSMGDIRTNQPSTILGYPTAEFEDMADIGAGAFPLAYSDFQRSYLIVDRKGMSLLRDPYSKKPYVQFYYYARNGGDVRDFDALKYLKIATT